MNHTVYSRPARCGL